MLLNSSRAKQTIRIIDSSLKARMSPMSSMPLKYRRTRQETTKSPHQKAAPAPPSTASRARAAAGAPGPAAPQDRQQPWPQQHSYVSE